MASNIYPQFKQLGSEALENYDKDAMPRFGGNEQVPIQANVNPGRLIDALQESASSDRVGSSESKQVLQTLADEHNGWNISAGIHEGGLGGAGLAADPNKHITLSTGHHVQLNDKGEIKRITGQGIEHRPAKNTGPSDTENDLAHLKEHYGLSDAEAAKAQLLHKHGNADRTFTQAQAAQEIINRRRK
jgi:hypothetical protein